MNNETIMLWNIMLNILLGKWKKTIIVTFLPTKKEARKCCRDIWSKEMTFNEKADLIERLLWYRGAKFGYSISGRILKCSKTHTNTSIQTVDCHFFTSFANIRGLQPNLSNDWTTSSRGQAWPNVIVPNWNQPFCSRSRLSNPG